MTTGEPVMALPLDRRFVALTRSVTGETVVIGLDHIIVVYDDGDLDGASTIILVGGNDVTVEGTVEDIKTRLGR
ncbi:MAG: hypothetical protein GY708_12965 [Actinomycetia bacterium]|nr:hypothetical protein [Actinomycetes bacterium]